MCKSNVRSHAQRNVQGPGAYARVMSTLGRPGEPLPDLVLPRLDGELLDLRELRGRRVALFFWGSW